MFFSKAPTESAHLGNTYVSDSIVANTEPPWYVSFLRNDLFCKVRHTEK